MKKNKVIAGCVLAVIVLIIMICFLENKEEKNDQNNDQENVVSDDIDDLIENNTIGEILQNIPEEEQIPEAEKTADGKLQFPCKISEQELVIRTLDNYEGIYLEDGSDVDVSEVAVVVLQNVGDTDIEYANISISGDENTLQFETSAIPAGAYAVVQEKNRTAYQKGTYETCEAQVAELESFEMSEASVTVEETEKGSLKITNLTGKDIPTVRIFYKFYTKSVNAYIGGITYTAKITNLEAGSSTTVTPSHYIAGKSKIMMVRVYDTAQ